MAIQYYGLLTIEQVNNISETYARQTTIEATIDEEYFVRCAYVHGLKLAFHFFCKRYHRYMFHRSEFEPYYIKAWDLQNQFGYYIPPSIITALTRTIAFLFKRHHLKTIENSIFNNPKKLTHLFIKSICSLFNYNGVQVIR